MPAARSKKIWIDLDNSPHVPFFDPIIRELRDRGYQIILTARDCFQVCGLADLFNMQYERIGRHYGKNMILKVMGTLIRSLQLLPTAIKQTPALAVSHGSRSQLLAASILRIPVVLISDYEYTKGVGLVEPDWIILPELIPDSAISSHRDRAFRYPGIKEDVYVPEFKPDAAILKELGIEKKDILVTIRPPATEAHYHNPESEKLFAAVIEFLGGNPEVQMVILPRNEKKQTAWVKNKWSAWCANGKIIIPEHVVNGLNLIWHSDFVVSGGGTMNREAAALGVPVYSIFRGKIGAVDRYLSVNDRLTLLESVDDVERKLRVVRRERTDEQQPFNKVALKKIVDQITAFVEKKRNFSIEN